MTDHTLHCYQLGLLGYPLGHSRSPQLHEAALKHARVEGSYQLFAIPPDDPKKEQIPALLERVRTGDLQGINVTIPHKQTVIPLLDQVSEVARAVGAVNTIYLDSLGRLAGENTDVPGFIRDVSQLVGTDPGNALVLGAGGSARAVVYGLGRAGWKVQVLARRKSQAEEVTAAVGYGTPGELNRSQLERAAFDLLVNTTPVGMFPNSADCPWPEDLPLPSQSAVYDLIYNPEETILLKRARESGLSGSNGEGMLISQALAAFKIWTEIDIPFEVMERAFHREGS